MGFAILRLAKRRTGAALAMARHALREGETPNADPSRKHENLVLAGKGSAAEVIADLEAKLPAKRRKDAVTCLEFLVGMSPEDGARLSRKQQEAYFRASLEFLGGRFGGSANIVCAVIHWDETTPHMQVLAVPLLDGKLNAKALVGNAGDLRKLQTQFAETCGKPSGLIRGVKGSPAKHTTIKQFYGAIQAAGSATALPSRVEMPPEPSPFDFIRGKAGAMNEAREQAAKANAKRQTSIEALARVGFATKGHQARQAGVAIARAQELEKKIALDRAAADRAWSKVDELIVELKEEAAKARQVVDLEALRDYAHNVQNAPKRPILKPADDEAGPQGPA